MPSVRQTTRLDGGAGNDRISGSQQSDLIIGGEGNDRLFGNGGADRIEGGLGNDRISGGDGPDVILGGLGNDVIHGGAGNDEIYGEGNVDQEAPAIDNPLSLGDALAKTAVLRDDPGIIDQVSPVPPGPVPSPTDSNDLIFGDEVTISSALGSAMMSSLAATAMMQSPEEPESISSTGKRATIDWTVATKST